MPPRALEALRTADVVCCEDTRVTGKLLSALGVEGKRLERLDEEMIASRASAVLDRVSAGERVVYCSDAGMPGVSDPGQRLIDAAYGAGVSVEVLPGPTAVATAYVASGFTCPRFYFGGFFPRKAGERAQVVGMLNKLDAVSVFYESPQRVVGCLEAIAAELPTRRVAVCRELTKLHEEVVRGTAAELAHDFAARAKAGAIKGEIVVVVDVASEEEAQAMRQASLDAARAEALRLRAEGAFTKKEIAALLQETYGIARNDAYDLVHGL